MIRSNKCRIRTDVTIKQGLTKFDDKRWYPDGVNTLALGHYPYGTMHLEATNLSTRSVRRYSSIIDRCSSDKFSCTCVSERRKRDRVEHHHGLIDKVKQRA
ncbi:hypothetical protein CHS0354_038008 [Potamilus streckersoni]|uniref:Uncharacterized protein n=1 Tax=Potamilus streckersoni TaxID=2493646 RepID=A0AAE0WDG3_9BIVA|nr:hypothetical protein CHS0354_038008 [Potamilus streckersoni]